MDLQTLPVGECPRREENQAPYEMAVKITLFQQPSFVDTNYSLVIFSNDVETQRMYVKKKFRLFKNSILIFKDKEAKQLLFSIEQDSWYLQDSSIKDSQGCLIGRLVERGRLFRSHWDVLDASNKVLLVARPKFLSYAKPRIFKDGRQIGEMKKPLASGDYSLVLEDIGESLPDIRISTALAAFFADMNVECWAGGGG